MAAWISVYAYAHAWAIRLLAFDALAFWSWAKCDLDLEICQSRKIVRPDRFGTLSAAQSQVSGEDLSDFRCAKHSICHECAVPPFSELPKSSHPSNDGV